MAAIQHKPFPGDAMLSEQSAGSARMAPARWRRWWQSLARFGASVEWSCAMMLDAARGRFDR